MDHFLVCFLMSLIHPVIFTDQHPPSHVLRILPAFWVAENIGEQGYIVSLEQLWLLWACIKPLFTNAMRPQCACNCDIIMAYGSMPYVGMAPKNNGGHFKSAQWHTQNVCVRLVKGIHEPYQALLECFHGQREHYLRWRVPGQQVAKTGKSSTFWLLATLAQ